MLEKLIANLKESLPVPLRKKLGIEDNTNEEEQSEQDSDEESKDSHDTSDNESEKKKKQMSMIIRVVVILGLAYLAVDQFVLKNDSSDAEFANIPVKPRKPRKKPVPPPTEEVKPEVVEQAAPEMAPEIVVEAVPEASPVENINIADKKIEEILSEASSATPEVDKIVLESEPIAQATGEVKSNDTQIEKSLDSLIESVDGKTTDETTTKKETRLEDKIVEDDVYTPPPQYDQMGRGLVYNCKEKYWACVDKISYVACNKNMKWNKVHGKPVECTVQNVYNSDDDCTIIQKYNISTSKSTSFCQE